MRVDSADARRVDVGELVDAEYQPGRRLLGVLSFVGDPAEVKVDVSRDAAYRLKPAIVQQAELHTYLSAEGTSQTQAEFRLHTKAQYLEIRLPDGSELWSALVDGKPVKPQCEAMPPAGDKPSQSRGSDCWSACLPPRREPGARFEARL